MTPEKQRASQGKFMTPLQRPLFVGGASGERAARYEGQEDCRTIAKETRI
jgi:hypothetical protein